MSLYFFIEVKDTDGNWHLVKWYSDRKIFDTNAPTKWDFQKAVTMNDGTELWENYEISTGLAWRDELGWARNFEGLSTCGYPSDISPELDKMLKENGELLKESRIKLGFEEEEYDYRRKYETLYLSDMYDVCEKKLGEWKERLKGHIKDEQLTDISDRLSIIEKLVRGKDVKEKKKEKADKEYEDTLEYYFDEYLSDVMALYRETNILHEKACSYTGDKWLGNENVRLIYYFD